MHGEDLGVGARHVWGQLPPGPA